MPSMKETGNSLQSDPGQNKWALRRNLGVCQLRQHSLHHGRDTDELDELPPMHGELQSQHQAYSGKNVSQLSPAAVQNKFDLAAGDFRSGSKSEVATGRFDVRFAPTTDITHRQSDVRKVPPSTDVAVRSPQSAS